jgi:hypothetical protein
VTFRDTGHLPASNRRVARTQHDPIPIKEQAMERYINHRPGERRIQVEIDEGEIAQIAASPDSAAARELAAIIADAHRRFQGASS